MSRYKVKVSGSTPDNKRRVRVLISTSLFMDNVVDHSPVAWTIEVGHEKELRVEVYENDRVALITLMGGIKPYSKEDGCLSVSLDAPVLSEAEEEKEAVELIEELETLAAEQPLEDLIEPVETEPDPS